ncbi:unnamed protein product [Alternaria alternata]
MAALSDEHQAIGITTPKEHRARRCNLIATCVKSSHRSRGIDGRQVVLRNGKLWIDTGTEDGSPLGHPYAGYYLPYPDTNHEGLVTTITDVAPIMNWVYVDKETGEVKYGVRADAQPNLTGPFDCTRQDRRLTFDGWEGWCAVEEAPGLWGLYFDLGDDGLKPRVAPGTRVLEIELSRKEKRFQKEADARQQDQTTKRAVDAKEDAPVDQPLAAEALVSKPGVVDEEGSQGSDKQESYRPMKIPQSIFEDPPPMVESLVFRPATPPPAYSPTVEGDPRTLDSTSKPNVGPAETSGMGQIKSSPGIGGSLPSITTEPLPTEAQSTSGEESEVILKQEDVARTQPASSLIDDKKSTPEKADSSPAEQQSPSVSEKRTTPKLNRSSGSRALAQAQKFEALAAAQKPDSNVRRRSNERGSRANSTTSSVYSNEGESLSTPGVSVQPQASPTPAPLALAISKANQAKALAAREHLLCEKIQPYRELKLRQAPGRSYLYHVDQILPGQVPVQQRERSVSGLSSSSSRVDTSRSSPRSSSITSGRQSLARTMTSGKGNQGMSNRIGGSQGRVSGTSRQPATAARGNERERSATNSGRKTTSALFREIDDLVSLESQDGQAKR